MTESGHEGFVVKPETHKRARPDQIRSSMSPVIRGCWHGIWGFCRAGDAG